LFTYFSVYAKITLKYIFVFKALTEISKPEPNLDREVGSPTESPLRYGRLKFTPELPVEKLEMMAV